MSGIFRRRRLPHWDVEGAAYFVTGCLAGSIPASGLRELDRYRAWLNSQPQPECMNRSQWEQHKQKLVFIQVEKYLDFSPARDHLRRPELASIVRNSLLFFAGERYHLYSYVVMPSHFHWLFLPLESWYLSVWDPRDERTPRERIMHSAKTYTARRCNLALGRTGQFWQDESYDHWVDVDDEESLERITHYIENNPVRAGLVKRPEDWPYSSAADRVKRSIKD